jgi:hypothetical protein
MPTIPNFLNAPSPLGNAFKGLASVLMNRPTDQEQMREAAQYNLMQAQGAEAQQKLQQGATQDAARTKLGTLIADPRLYDSTFRPNATPAPADLGELGVESTPIAKAFRPDMGQILQTSVEAGYKPDDLSKLFLVGAANGSGARSDITQNAQVGSGENFGSTFGAFDTTEANKVGMNDADNKQSDINNRRNNATSRANNSATIAAADRRAAEGDTALDPTTISYLAEQVRNGAPLPALGMGKNAAAMRQAILQEAAKQDLAAGRTGTDAALAKQDYAGNLAGNRVLATRTAAIGTAVHALDNVIPTVKAQLDEVTRTGLYPADVIVNAAQVGTNDPVLAKLAVGINDVVSLHARATNPNGEVTDAGRAQGYKLLNQVHDAKYLGAAMDQMLVSAKRELAAPGQTRDDVHASQRGVLSGGRGGDAPAAPAAPEQWHRDPKTGKLVKGG